MQKKKKEKKTTKAKKRKNRRKKKYAIKPNQTKLHISNVRGSLNQFPDLFRMGTL